MSETSLSYGQQKRLEIARALEVQNIVVSYGLTEVLHGVSIHINEGELISVIGHNGAGKSTLLKSIAGILTPVEGSIKWNHDETASMQADQIVKMGISLVPEGRTIKRRRTADPGNCKSAYEQAWITPFR